jgi:hypothetical protein
MAEILCANHFAPFVDKPFQAAGHPQVLILVRLETREPAGWEAAPRKPFSLILRGPPDEIVPEGLHRFTVDGHWEFDLYLVPIQTVSHTHQNYQIVFN